MDRAVRLLIPIGLIFLLTACGEGFFSSLDDPQETEFGTVEPGSMVEPGGVIPLSITYRSEETEPATAMSVVVRSATGTVVHEYEYDATILASRNIPGLQLAGLPEGVYFVEVTAWRNGTLLFSEDRQIFVSDNAPEIRSLTVYPSRLARGAQAVAIAEVDAGENHRPFVRWSTGGRLVLEGYFSDGNDRAVFSGGTEPGVYRIHLEVFPWGPEEGVRPDHGTVIKQNGDLVVRDVSGENPGADDLLLLYDFAGRLDPVVSPRVDDDSEQVAGSGEGDTESGRDSDLTIRPNEGVVLDVVDSRLGYRLDRTGTMTVPVSMFPVDHEYAIELDFRFVALSAGAGTIFTIDPDRSSGLPELRLKRSSDPAGYALEVQSEGRETATLAYATELRDGAAAVKVTVLRHAGELLLSLQVDEEPLQYIHVVDLPVRNPETPYDTLLVPGRITLGGTAPILVTALGFRRRDPADIVTDVEEKNDDGDAGRLAGD